jgi:hypothetical protein
MSRIKDYIYDLMEAGVLDWENPRYDNYPFLPALPKTSRTTSIYGLYADNKLVHIYKHKDTADYECWLCNLSNKVSESFHYEVKLLPFTPHTYSELRRN